MSDFHLETYLQQLSAATSIDDCPKVPIPSIQKNQNYLFISYSHRDYKAVYADLAHLYAQNVRFWYDKGLSVGKEWENEVEEHIKHPNCCGIIFFISPNMFLSNSVLKEIAFTQKRKKGNIIYQKNYFCVNLHKGNISDILFEAQTSLRNKSLPLLDTNVVNILTSTFSDSATYINAASKYHIDALLEQINLQFDVTSSLEPAPELSVLQSADTPKAAIRTVIKGKIGIAPLIKYLSACYRENPSARPWYLIPVALVLGIAVMALTWHRALTLEGAPFVSLILSQLGPAANAVLGIVFCVLLWPYSLLTLFWLYYLSPVYEKCERNPKLTTIHHILFLVISLCAALLIPALYFTLAFLILSLINIAKSL